MSTPCVSHAVHCNRQVPPSPPATALVCVRRSEDKAFPEYPKPLPIRPTQEDLDHLHILEGIIGFPGRLPLPMHPLGHSDRPFCHPPASRSLTFDGCFATSVRFQRSPPAPYIAESRVRSQSQVGTRRIDRPPFAPFESGLTGERQVASTAVKASRRPGNGQRRRNQVRPLQGRPGQHCRLYSPPAPLPLQPTLRWMRIGREGASFPITPSARRAAPGRGARRARASTARCPSARGRSGS